MRILGVELGTWSLKAVEMELRFRRVDILDFHEVRLPLQMLDPTTTYKQAIQQLLARLPSHPEKIVTSVPPAQTALRFLPLPIKQRKQVEKTFRFELEDNIPFKLDDSIIEHHVEKTREGHLVFAAIAPKRHIQTHVDWLKAVGLDPDWLTFDGMGVVNLYLASVATATESVPGPVMVLDIGHLKTNISIFEQDRMQFFRSIAWGGAALTNAISITQGCTIEEAERFKMNDLKLDEDGAKSSAEVRELLFAATEAFSPFITDINHSLVAYRNLYQQGIESIYITGGTAKAWGIDNFLRRALNVPISQFKAFSAGVTVKDELNSADEYRFAEPLGRAMVFSRKVPLLFNFRQQEISKETSLTEVSAFLKDENVVRLLKFSGVLAAVLFFHVMIAGWLAEDEARLATDELRKVFSQTFPAVPAKLKTSLTASPKELKKFIEQKNNELDQKLKMIAKVRVPTMGLIRDISDAFPADVKVDVNTLQLDDRTFMLEGVLYSGEINRVTEGLKKLAYLSKITLQRDGQRFTYRGDIVGR